MSKIPLQLKILTPLGLVFDGEVDQVTVTTTSGEITVLRDHIPLVTTLTTGKVFVRVNGAPRSFTITGGVLEKRYDNEVIILSNRSESAQEIDLERAEKAYARAEEMMKEAREHPELQDYSNLQEVMTKELNRVRIARKQGRQ